MRWVFFSAIVWTMACGPSGAPPERVNKLRAVGVTTDPILASPSDGETANITTLTFHALVPTGETISVSNFSEDDTEEYAVTTQPQLVDDSETYQDYEELRYYRVNAVVTIPSNELLSFSDERGAARLRYGLTLESSSGEVEKVVGTVFVLPADTDESFEPLGVSIVTPNDGGAIPRKGDFDIEAEVTNPNDEPVKFGWFASGGRIENRRARETTWETGDEDKQLLIATIRGKRSRSFALQIVELNTE